jgi:hypothetical protein
MFKKLSLVLACLLLFSVTPVMAQDLCEGNFNYDNDVDGSDASTFKSDFGRSGLKNPCPGGFAAVAKTGQTTSIAPGDDGDLERGVPLPNPRFTVLYYYNAGTEEVPDYTACNPPTVDCEDVYGEPDPTNDMVLDNLTGLYWARHANWFPGAQTWTNALAPSGPIAWMNYWRFCDNNDWRLPNVKELQSLIDLGQYDPALPSGHPFVNVLFGLTYWSSTTYASYPGSAWGVGMANGGVGSVSKISGGYVWPVRGGH